MANQKNLLTFILLAIMLAGCNSEPEFAGNPENVSGNVIESSTVDGVMFTRLSDSSSSSISVGSDGGFRARGTLLSIIAYAASDASVVNETVLPSGHFLIEIAPPPSRDETEKHIRSKLKELLTEKFNVTFDSVNRERAVLLLVDLDSGRTNVEIAETSDPRGWGTSGKGYEFRNQSVGDLADFLSNKLGEFVLDETNDTKMYSFELAVNVFEAEDKSDWANGLKSIGLQLREAKRNIQFTVIESADQE